MRLIIFFIIFLLMACEGRSITSEKKIENEPPPKIIVEKEKNKEEPLKPEVKIKLKRDGKDNYSWELSGSDPDEILKVNEKFKKRLAGEQSR